MQSHYNKVLWNLCLRKPKPLIFQWDFFYIEFSKRRLTYLKSKIKIDNSTLDRNYVDHERLVNEIHICVCGLEWEHPKPETGFKEMAQSRLKDAAPVGVA